MTALEILLTPPSGLLLAAVALVLVGVLALAVAWGQP